MAAVPRGGDVFPTLIELGGLRLPTYGALLALGFLVGTTLVRRRAPRRGRDAARQTTRAAATTLAGFLGSRAWFVAGDWQRLRAEPWRASALWEGGAVWYGALFGGLLA
jgi:prolipoprotein diacylglyceryltransferase